MTIDAKIDSGMSTGAQPASGVATYRIVRELGARSQPSYAAIREPHELVVVHRFVNKNARTGAGFIALSPEALGLLLRDAQCLAKNWHPNIARIKHVDLAAGDLTIASELVDGSTLADLFELTKTGGEFSLDVLVRVLLDVLAGIHCVHGLRDARSMALGAIHGELCPTNIVVGRDGVARIINVLRARPFRVGAGSEAVGYAAPEALDGGAVDARADIHAVGVILWEALSGKRLHEEKDPARVLSRQREIDIPRPALPSGSPYSILSDIAMRALAFDPALRFRTAAEMAAELRKLPAARIATGSVVASRVLSLDGDRIRRRRVALDPTSTGGRRRTSGDSIVAVQAKAEKPKESEQTGPAASAPRPVAPAPPRPEGREPADPDEETDPPASIELIEDVSPSVPPPTVNAERSAGRPPPVPPRAAPAAKGVPAPAVVERLTVPTPAIALGPTPAVASVVEERVTVPSSPVNVIAASPVNVVAASPVVEGIDARVVERAAFDDEDPAPSDLARSTSTAIAEHEPTPSDAPAAGAGAMAAGVLESLDGVDVPRAASKRRKRALALGALCLLLGGVFFAVRSATVRTGSADPPAPTQAATSPTPVAPTTSTPVIAANEPADPSPAASGAESAPAPAAEPAAPSFAEPASGPTPEASADDAPKPAPRPPSNRRYEPLGI